MNAPSPTRSLVWIAATALAVVALAPLSLLAQDHHMPGRDDPWGSGNCTGCHGSELTGSLSGGIGPSCMSCHNDFVSPDLPEKGHHMPDRDDPLGDGSCNMCHGADLNGSEARPSCYSCHMQMWDGEGVPIVDHGGPYQGAVGQDMHFDASDTFDPNGDPLTYMWIFGDGGQPQFPKKIPTTSHIYGAAGTYTVVLTVTDGISDPVVVTMDVLITSENLPPDVDPGDPYSGDVDQPVQFDASGTFDIDGDTLSYQWDFGDGSTPPPSSESPTISHTFTQEGTYTVELEVDDGVNDPVVVQMQVQIDDTSEPPPSGGNGGTGGTGTGGTWAVRIPFLFVDFTVKMEDFGGIILFESTLPSGEVVFGIGMDVGGTIFWMDVNGAIFYGNIDYDAGTMRGIVFDYAEGSSIWSAERL